MYIVSTYSHVYVYIYICIYVCVYNFETSSFRILLQDKLCSSKASTGLCTGLLLDSSLPIKFLRWGLCIHS